MTAHRPGVRQPEPGETVPEPRSLSTAAILGMCDRLLDEVGRRRHMFAWLRAPGASAGEWLAVDAYYPRARVVVMCGPSPGAHDSVYRKLVPAHGFELLMLDPAVLGADPPGVEAAIAAKLFDLEHVPRRDGDAERAALTAERRSAKRPSEPIAPRWTPMKVERTPVTPALKQGVGMMLGLALAAILIAEVYLDVVYVFGAGRILLGFAIALEACSRALGTVAAAQAGERAWACACAIGGAPVVAWYALRRRAGREPAEPAPLAGLLAALAGALALLALLFGS
jgi:hypothetical protein